MRNRESRAPTVALINSGSDPALISSARANRIEILTNILSMTKKMNSRLLHFSISSLNHPQPLPIKSVWVVQDLQFLPCLATASSNKSNYIHFIDIPFESQHELIN